MKTITQAEFRSQPSAAIRHATTHGPVTVVNGAGEPVFTIGGPQVVMGTVEAVGRDPTDDAAWPLPADDFVWSRWDPGVDVAVRLDGFGAAFINAGILVLVKGPNGYARDIPLAALDILRARWEAGQA